MSTKNVIPLGRRRALLTQLYPGVDFRTCELRPYTEGVMQIFQIFGSRQALAAFVPAAAFRKRRGDFADEYGSGWSAFERRSDGLWCVTVGTWADEIDAPPNIRGRWPQKWVVRAVDQIIRRAANSTRPELGS